MLDVSKHLIYEGCREDNSPLSAATRMTNIQMDFNLSKDCVDVIGDFICHIKWEEKY